NPTVNQNTHWSGSITYSTQMAEWDRWQAKLNPQTRISGMVYLDADKDGKHDAGEVGLSGWRVYIDKNVNGKFDSGEVSAMTDSSGKYQVLGLAPGAYQVRVVELSGYVRTNPISGYRGVTLNTGELDDGWDF